jgi:hypothetical protein
MPWASNVTFTLRDSESSIWRSKKFWLKLGTKFRPSLNGTASNVGELAVQYDAEDYSTSKVWRFLVVQHDKYHGS